jgi:hypothetical protein
VAVLAQATSAWPLDCQEDQADLGAVVTQNQVVLHQAELEHSPHSPVIREHLGLEILVATDYLVQDFQTGLAVAAVAQVQPDKVRPARMLVTVV